MNWLLRVFSHRKSNSAPPPSVEKKQDVVSFFHIVIEETIMAAAQWLIGFIQQILDGKMAASQQPSEPSPSNAPNETEGLSLKAVLLLEQLYDRTSSFLTLEQRLSSVEAALSQTTPTSVDSSDSSSETVGTLLQAMDSLIQQFQQEEQRMSTLEQRMSRLEQLLTKYNVVSKLLEQQHHAIVALQSRMSELESPHQNNNHQSILQLSNLEN